MDINRNLRSPYDSPLNGNQLTSDTGSNESKELQVDKKEIPYHTVPTKKSEQEKVSALLKREMVISSQDSVFSQLGDSKIVFPLSVILNFLKEELSLEFESRLITGSVAFALRYFDSMDVNFNDIDLFFEAKKEVNVQLMSSALEKFLQNYVIPKIGSLLGENKNSTTSGKLTEKETKRIIQSFLVSAQKSSTFYQISFGPDLDITFSKQDYDLRYRCANTDSIAYDLDNNIFRVSKEGGEIDEIDEANLKGIIIPRPFDKVSQLSVSTFFYYVLLWSWGLKASPLFMKGLDQKLSQLLLKNSKDSSFGPMLDRYLDKHFDINESGYSISPDSKKIEAALFYLLNIIFLVESFSSRNSVDQHLSDPLLESVKKRIDQLLISIEESGSLIQKIAHDVIKKKTNLVKMNHELQFFSSWLGLKEASWLSNELTRGWQTERIKEHALVNLDQRIGIAGPSCDRFLKRRIFLIIPLLQTQPKPYINPFTHLSFHTFTKSLKSEKNLYTTVEKTSRIGLKKGQLIEIQKWNRENVKEFTSYTPSFERKQDLISGWKKLFQNLLSEARKHKDRSQYLLASRYFLYMIFSISNEKNLIESLTTGYLKLLAEHMITTGKDALDTYQPGFVPTEVAAARLFILTLSSKSIQKETSILNSFCKRFHPSIQTLNPSLQSVLYSAALTHLNSCLLDQGKWENNVELIFSLSNIVVSCRKTAQLYYAKKHKDIASSSFKSSKVFVDFLNSPFIKNSSGFGSRSLCSLLSLYKNGVIHFDKSSHHEVWKQASQYFLDFKNAKWTLLWLEKAVPDDFLSENVSISLFKTLMEPGQQQLPKEALQKLWHSLAQKSTYVHLLLSFWENINDKDIFKIIIETITTNPTEQRNHRALIFQWMEKSKEYFQESPNLCEKLIFIIQKFSSFDELLNLSELKSCLSLLKLSERIGLLKPESVDSVCKDILKKWIRENLQSRKNIENLLEELDDESPLLQVDRMEDVYTELIKAYTLMENKECILQAIMLMKRLDLNKTSDEIITIPLNGIYALFTKKNFVEAKELYFFAKSEKILLNEKQIANDFLQIFQKLPDLRKDGLFKITAAESIFYDLRDSLDSNQIEVFIKSLLECQKKQYLSICTNWALNLSKDNNLIVQLLTACIKYNEVAPFEKLLDLLHPIDEFQQVSLFKELQPFSKSLITEMKDEKKQLELIRLLIKNDEDFKENAIELVTLILVLHHQLTSIQSPHLKELEIIKRTLFNSLIAIQTSENLEAAYKLLLTFMDDKALCASYANALFSSHPEKIPAYLSMKGSCMDIPVEEIIDQLSNKSLKAIFHLTASENGSIAARALKMMIENKYLLSEDDLLPIALQWKNIANSSNESLEFLNSFSKCFKLSNEKVIPKDFWRAARVSFLQQASTRLHLDFSLIEWISRLPMNEQNAKEAETFKKEFLEAMILANNPTDYATIMSQYRSLDNFDLITKLLSQSQPNNSYLEIAEAILEDHFDNSLFYLLTKRKLVLGIGISKDLVNRDNSENTIKLLKTAQLVCRMHITKNRKLLKDISLILQELFKDGKVSESLLLIPKNCYSKSLKINLHDELRLLIIELFYVYLSIPELETKHYVDLFPYLEIQDKKIQKDLFLAIIQSLVESSPKLLKKDKETFLLFAKKLVFELYRDKLSQMKDNPFNHSNSKQEINFLTSLFCVLTNDSDLVQFGLKICNLESMGQPYQNHLFLTTLFNSSILVNSALELDQIELICIWSAQCLEIVANSNCDIGEDILIYTKILDYYLPLKKSMAERSAIDNLMTHISIVVQKNPLLYLSPLKIIYQQLFKLTISAHKEKPQKEILFMPNLHKNMGLRSDLSDIIAQDFLENPYLIISSHFDNLRHRIKVAKKIPFDHARKFSENLEEFILDTCLEHLKNMNLNGAQGYLVNVFLEGLTTLKWSLKCSPNQSFEDSRRNKLFEFKKYIMQVKNPETIKALNIAIRDFLMNVPTNEPQYRKKLKQFNDDFMF